MEGKMRKFKLFIASMLTYFMAISLLPTSLLQTIAKAAENEYTTLVKSDYYLRANGQYKDKALIAYTKPGFDSKEVYLSLVEGGKETLLKEIKDSRVSRIITNKKSKAVIEYYNSNYENYYEEFNFDNLEFRSISEKEYEDFEIDSNDFYSYGSYSTYIHYGTENKDEIIENVLQKINKSYDKYNFTISDKEPSYNMNETKYSNDNEDITIYMYEKGSYNEELNIKIDLYDFKIKEYNKLSDTYKYYAGIVTDKNVLIEEYSKSEEFENRYMEMIYQGKDSLFLYHYLDNGKKKTIEVKGNEIIVNQISDFNLWNSTKIGNDLYVYNNGNKKLEIYSLEGNQYKISKEIDCLASKLSYLKKSEFPIMLQKENGKVYFSQIVDGNIIKKVDITNGLSKFYDINTENSNEFSSTLYIQCDNYENYFISNNNDFMIVQKNKSYDPSQPEEPNTPGDNGNVVVIPSNDKVVAEVSKINPNDKNEIKVNTEASAKKVEVLIKDVESLKSGTGSLNITINNGVTMNLPLSTIDKSLLEGADNVTIKLDVVENSDIIKQIKAVNKVFDFNLIITKGNESLNIHNFKDGLAEVTLNLTDEDLKELNKDKLVVYYYNDVEKTFEAMETVVNGNKITFKTPHFSKYVVAEKVTDTNGGSSPSEGANDNTNNNTETGKGNLPETGSVVSNNVILVLAIGIVAIGGIMFFRKRKHA
jgi:LPXTG-motif cell wall-anchored protein